MTYFTTREESSALVVVFETASGLNDFRNNALRDALYQFVDEQASPRIVADLANVDYLSSSGVALLLGLKRRVESRGGKIVYYNIQPMVKDLLTVMKLDRFFNLADSEALALDSVRPAPSV